MFVFVLNILYFPHQTWGYLDSSGQLSRWDVAFWFLVLGETTFLVSKTFSYLYAHENVIIVEVMCFYNEVLDS